MRRVAIAGLVAVVSVAASWLPAVPAAVAATGSVQLLSQTAWVTPGSEFVMRLGVDASDSSELELSVAVHQAVSNRTQFQRTIENRVSGSPIEATSAPVGELERDAGGAVRVVLPVNAPAPPGGRGRLLLRRPGVYPVRVELRELGGGDVVDRLTTHLVFVPPSTDGPRLGVTVIVPIHAPPARRPDGEIELAPAFADAVAGVARAVANSPAGAVVLDPTPETLIALDRERGAEVMELLRRAATGRQVVPGPFVPIVPAAFEGGLEAEMAAQQSYGTEVVKRLLHPEPDGDTAIVDGPADDATVARLRDQQVEKLVLPESALAPIPLVVTLAQPFRVRGRQGREVAAASADAGLAAHAASGAGAVLGAHHLLADLAVIYFDNPGLVRGVVAAIPRQWKPDPRFVEAALTGLASSPVLLPIDLDTLFRDVPPAAARRQPLVRDLAPAPSATAIPTDRVVEARQRLTAFSSMPEPDAPILEELEQRLLVAESADLRGRDRRSYLDSFTAAVDEQLRGIQIPRSRSITLTAREGEIPVTMRSDLGYRMRVVLELSSDKLEFPDGNRIEVMLGRRNTTKRFDVRARTSGSFPLRVVVVSPEGELVVAESRFTVRSTAASGVGVILSVSALAFLLLWWLRHVVRSRRSGPRQERAARRG